MADERRNPAARRAAREGRAWWPEATPTKSGQAPRRSELAPGWRAPHASRLTPQAFPRGFTLTELLVVVGIVVVLLSILIVAVNAAARTAQKANTQFLMTSIKQSLVRFKEDVGYYPPVLDDDRNLLKPVVNPLLDSYRQDVQVWFSSTTLVDYLIGPGSRQEDGYGAIDLLDPNDREKPRIGVRHPGPDGLWGATVYGDADGTLGARNPANTGTVLGPYLELKDQHLLASTQGQTDAAGHLIVFSPGEGGYNPNSPKVLVDYWAKPIRYYRAPYPPGALHAAYRAVDRNLDGTTDPPPSLADVIALRPYSIKPGSESDNLGVPDFGNPGDTSIVLSMRTAEFGLLSAGPDRALDLYHRVDGKELNKDNIVELGP